MAISKFANGQRLRFVALGLHFKTPLAARGSLGIPSRPHVEDGEVVLQKREELGECRKECSTLIHACRVLPRR